jgi:hypothetical protein
MEAGAVLNALVREYPRARLASVTEVEVVGFEFRQPRRLDLELAR